MQISLRSQMVAGTAAIVGASAMAMTPVVTHLPAVQLPAAATAEVALAGFDSPLTELNKTVNLMNQWLLLDSNNNAAYAGLSNIDILLVPAVKAGLGFSKVGLLPQITTDRLPIITQLGVNGGQYLWSTANALTTIVNDMSEGVWNAAGDLLTLNIPAALAEITTAIQNSGQTALDAGNFVLQNVIAKLGALVAGVPDLVKLVGGGAIGQLTVLAGAVVNYAKAVVTSIGSGNIETIWNTAVDGLLGPTGLAGGVVSLTVGMGVQPKPLPSTDVVPSVRGVIQGSIHGVADALAVTAMVPPVPPPAASKRGAAAAVRAAAASAPEAPATEAAPVTAPEKAAEKAGDNAGDAPKGGLFKRVREAASAGSARAAASTKRVRSAS